METVTKGEYNDDERTVMHNLADVGTATKDSLAEAGMDWADEDAKEVQKILDAAKESSETDGNYPKDEALDKLIDQLAANTGSDIETLEYSPAKTH